MWCLPGRKVNDMARVLAVDPGDQRIGLALSDPTRTLAKPLETFRHESRARDADRILSRATEHGAKLIVVGVALDAMGQVGPQARKCLRLARAIEKQGGIEVRTWDETGTSERALNLGERADLDARAAAVLLQDFLDAQEEI